MKDVFRKKIYDKNKNPYILIFSHGEDDNPIYQGGLYLVDESFLCDIVYECDIVGMCDILDEGDSADLATLSVDLRYRGLGLGKQMIQTAKEFSRQVLGKKTMRLLKLNRMIENPLKPGTLHDANLMLYLGENFKVNLKQVEESVLLDKDIEAYQKEGIQNTLEMVCDLEEEGFMSDEELETRIEQNKDYAYKTLGLN